MSPQHIASAFATIAFFLVLLRNLYVQERQPPQINDIQVYEFIAATAGVNCTSKRPVDTIPCTGTYNNRILVAAMLAYEVDTLQIALAEYDGVADVLITENLAIHSYKSRKQQKPLLLWPRLKSNPAFATFNSTVHYTQCTKSRTSNALWEQEFNDNKCVTDAVRQLASQYDVIVVGSVDEVLSRRTLLRLKHCHLPPLPASGAIGMPMGLLGRKFKTDWHHPSRPFSFSLPSVWAATAPNPRRRMKSLPGPAIVGGLHMTNYCFLPAMFLKTLWATESQTGITQAHAQSNPVALKDACYRYDELHTRISAPASPETRVPWLLHMCPSSFPAWYGKLDPREHAFQTFIRK